MSPDLIQLQRINTAEEEARRFLARVAELRKARNREDYPTPIQSAAVKRASMDLTVNREALANLLIDYRKLLAILKVEG